MSENYFSELSKVNVSAHVEKKGNFTYLSWPFAVQELGKVDPNATWKIERHNGMPYIDTPLGYFVEVSVTCKGVTKSQIHPVLDGRNKPIPTPSTFDINTSIQRALVKAIALHGLGLYIYAGEDLPDAATATVAPSRSITPVDGSLDALSKENQEKAKQIANGVVDLWNEGKEFAAYELFYENNLDNEMQLGIWEVLKPHSGIRNKLKKMHQNPTEKKAA